MENKKFISNKEGVCPVCNGTIMYGGFEIVDSTGGYYSWKCFECKTIGKEWIRTDFVEHYDVYDSNFNEVADLKDYKEENNND